MDYEPQDLPSLIHYDLSTKVDWEYSEVDVHDLTELSIFERTKKTRPGLANKGRNKRNKRSLGVKSRVEEKLAVDDVDVVFKIIKDD